ncbi:MAG: STAS domain-containing protein [Lentisphaeria bacterium]|nr:STAS domain-containing protein [Lentisphaeria bacterium]
MGELHISSRDGVYLVKVEGRATFECAPALRNLAASLDKENFREIRIDLGKCEWMDSTFMGILAMLGLRAKKIGAVISVHYAGQQNTELLCGLGLKKLFLFVDTCSDLDGCPLPVANGEQPKPTAENHARTVLEAHETLMDVDEGNVKKFDKVVDLVRKDLERVSGQDKQEN